MDSIDLELILVIISFVFLFLIAINKISKKENPNWITKQAISLLPIILIVLVIRTFMFEPFKIPSGSMIPTLLIGDFILVNKYEYGLRAPVTKTKIIDISKPKRGDVAVFRYPLNNKINYIKRIIGLPGDIILINNKKLKVNGKEIQKTQVSNDLPYLFTEDIDDKKIYILEDLSEKTSELKYVVPQNSYFVMGDNRDRSSDSRFWGFVPESNLVGKASLIWFSLGENIRFERIGNTIE